MNYFNLDGIKKDTNKVYKLPLFYNRLKKNPCVITINNNLELEMTQVIANHCDFTRLIKNMKFYPKMK